MHFNELNREIQNLTKDVTDHLSFFIHTPDGNITLNEDQPQKAASVAKLFILMEAFRQSEQGILDLNETVDMKHGDIVGGSGVIGYLTNPPNFNYRNLLELMTIVSDNTASNILLDKVGKEKINHFAKRIGCSQSKINRHFMDVNAQAAGIENYTSARDMDRLLNLYARKNGYITETSREQMLNMLSHQQLQDKLPKYAKENDKVIFFHKTGELQGVEHDVGIMKRKGTIIEAAILTRNWRGNSNGQIYIAEIGRLLLQYISQFDAK
jgi:beta-lactamase class A